MKHILLYNSFINELFDSSEGLIYKKIKGDEQSHKYLINTANEDLDLIVEFENVLSNTEDYDFPEMLKPFIGKIFKLSLTNKSNDIGKHDLNNLNIPFKVFATLKNISNDFIKEINPTTVLFMVKNSTIFKCVLKSIGNQILGMKDAEVINKRKTQTIEDVDEKKIRVFAAYLNKNAPSGYKVERDGEFFMISTPDFTLEDLIELKTMMP